MNQPVFSLRFARSPTSPVPVSCDATGTGAVQQTGVLFTLCKVTHVPYNF
jgi:hypothetical protein